MFRFFQVISSIFVDVQYWSPYSTDKFISCVLSGSSQWFFHICKEIVIECTWEETKTTTLGGTEPHHSSWQCKESHRCCCHVPLSPLAMGDSGTSTILTRYESMRLHLFAKVKEQLRDPCYSGVSKGHQQRWKLWWSALPSKHLTKGDK